MGFYPTGRGFESSPERQIRHSKTDCYTGINVMSWIRHKTRQPVRPLIGRLGCWREKLSIQTHLAYCEFKLRLRTGSTQTARLQLLDILHRYWRAGRFPQNNLRTPGRQPIFIDDAGVHCAVGYLMAQTGAEDLANAINQSDRFVYLEDLDLDRQPAIRAWLDQQGLKPAEAALIQPTYGPCGFGGGGGMPRYHLRQHRDVSRRHCFGDYFDYIQSWFAAPNR